MSPPTAAEGAPTRNADFPWDRFNSDWYFDHNYAKLRDDDRQIIKLVGEFFASVPATNNGKLRHGLDVGSGTNLYPALAMLPLCGEITLRERASTNRDWLHKQVDTGYASSWDDFWDELTAYPLYKIKEPRLVLGDRARIQRGSIFDLPVATWDIGTMFFVAESITHIAREFRRAVRCFVRALKPNSPFAAAFMIGSAGYDVGNEHFPAVAITDTDVRQCLSGVARDVNLHHVTSRGLREGYKGMLLATGRAT